MTIGKLIFNNESGAFETTIFNAGESYNLSLCDFTEEEENNAASLAKKIVIWLTTNIDAVKRYAASELITLKNETWLEEDESPLTETEFAGAIQFEGIIIFSDESSQIFFKDNDIFWGHSIVIDIDSNYNFSRASIAG